MKRPDPRTLDQILDVPTVAKIMRKHPMTIYRWIKTGQLPAHRLGNNKNSPLRIKESDLKKLANELCDSNGSQAC